MATRNSSAQLTGADATLSQAPSADLVEYVDEQELWARKRERQRRNQVALSAGRVTEDQVSWFSGGRARACELINSAY